MPGKNYKLKFTPKANEDLEQIYNYISEKLFAENAAHNLMEKIESSIIRLKSFPYSGSFVSDSALKGRGYHKLVVDNYIVFYLIDEIERQVVIMRILYGAQNYKGLL